MYKETLVDSENYNASATDKKGFILFMRRMIKFQERCSLKLSEIT